MNSLIDRRPAIAIALVAALLAMPGCTAKMPPRQLEPQGAIINWEKETPAGVLSRLREEGLRLANLTAFFSLSLNPPPPRQLSHLSGILYLSQSPDGQAVRIKALRPFGRTLFDMVHKEGRTNIYVPARKTMYQGTAGAEPAGDSGMGQVFAALMINATSLTPSPNAALTIRNGEVILPLVDGELRLDRGTGLIRTVRRRRQEVHYERYQDLTGHPPMPSRIRVTALDGSRTAICTLKDINLPETLTGAFDLSFYKPEHIRKLNELEGENSR